MTAAETGLEVTSGQVLERSRRPGRRRASRLLPVVVALVVLLLSEVAVRSGRSHLTDPKVWPTPELQTKYDQIGARAAVGRRPDVVLVGDSMMDAGGDSTGLAQALSGSRVYNAAIAGETLPVISDWTTRVVMPRLHPRVVVFGISSNELHPRALDPSNGAGAYRGSRVVRAAEGTGNIVDRADAFLVEHSMLYRYRGSIRQPFSTGVVDPQALHPEVSADGHDLVRADLGYLQKGGPQQARAVVRGVTAALAGFTVGPENVRILQETIATIRREGASVLLVAMPVTADLVSFHPNGEADYRAAMEALAGAAERSGAAFTQPGIWPQELFADPVHVNAAGAARLTSYLAPLVGQEVAPANLAHP